MKMKCLVCGNEFEDNECNVCGFPVVNFPDGTDYEENIKSIQPIIDSHKKAFLERVIVSLKIYNWKYTDGKVEPEGEQNLEFGTVSDIIRSTRWLGREFDRLSERDRVEASISMIVKKEDIDYDIVHKVSVPNLKADSPQELGISSDGETFVVSIRNRAGETAQSEKYGLFDTKG